MIIENLQSMAQQSSLLLTSSQGIDALFWGHHERPSALVVKLRNAKYHAEIICATTSDAHKKTLRLAYPHLVLLNLLNKRPIFRFVTYNYSSPCYPVLYSGILQLHRSFYSVLY